MMAPKVCKKCYFIDCRCASAGRSVWTEKVECDHEYKRTKMTRNPQEDGTVILAHCEVDNDFCPKCGEKL